MWSQSRRSDKLTQPALSKGSNWSSLLWGATASQCLPSTSSVTPPWTLHRPFHKFRMQKVIVWMVHQTENTTWYTCWHFGEFSYALQISALSQRKRVNRKPIGGWEFWGEAKWPLFHRNVWESRWQNSVCLRFLCVVLVTRFHPGWSSSCPHILASILHQSPTACEPPPLLCYVSLIFCYIGSRFHFWTAVIRYTTTCHACGSFLNFLSLDKYILRTFQHLVQY